MHNDEEEIPGIRVAVRLRPLNSAELGEGQTVGWQYNSSTILDDTGQGKKSYNFDTVLGPESTNRLVFEGVAADLVEKSLNGFNTTVFAYGQTGSGKTWTMMGDSHGKAPGIIPRALETMFKSISADTERNYVLRCSFLELYNESINDLLNLEGNGTNLTIIADDPAKGAIIGGLREEIISSVEDGMALINLGNENRKIAATSMNTRSSRSHTIFRVVLEATKTDEVLERERKLLESLEEEDDSEGGMTTFKSFSKQNDDSNTVVSYLNLVDLAGSERQKNTKTIGKHLKEGAAINKSLLALGAVIGALSESSSEENRKTPNAKNAKSSRRRGAHASKGAKGHIPYRNSKLTRILRQSLGGNTFTSIVIAMSPAPMYRDESRSSLKFGQMCKKIKNRVKKNTAADDKTLLKQYKLQIAKLKKQLVDEQANAEQEGTDVALAAQKAAEDESTALRKKLSILQTMYFEGNEDGEIELDKSTPKATKLWTKLKSGVKSKFLVDKSMVEEMNGSNSNRNLRRRKSVHVMSGVSEKNFKRNMAKTLREAEGYIIKRNGIGKDVSLSSKGESYYKEKIERLEKEIVAIRDQKDSGAEILTKCRKELSEAKSKLDEVGFEVRSKTEELEQMKHFRGHAEQLEVTVATLSAAIEGAKAEAKQVEEEHSEKIHTLDAQLETVQSQLAEETKRSNDLTKQLERQRRKVKELESLLEAGRNAMNTLQSKILGKSGQRLAIMAVDLENTVAEFNDKQEQLMEKEVRLTRKVKEADDREKSLTSREHAALEKEEAQAAVDTALSDRERQVEWWKDYAKMQENAFERRDSILDKIAQEQDARDIQLRMREKSATKRETSIVEEEARILQESVSLEQRKTALRRDQHALKLKQVHRSASMNIQLAVRSMLRKRAAEILVNSERVQKEVDRREREVGELEALHKRRAAELSALKVRLELQSAALERDMKSLRHREMAAQRRSEDILRSEERHREIQSETEERDLRSVEREQEVQEASERISDREREVEEAERASKAILEDVKKQRAEVHALREAAIMKSREIAEGETLLKQGEDNMKSEIDHLRLRAEAIDKQEEAMHTEAERVRAEWEEARRIRLANEAGEASREAERYALVQMQKQILTAKEEIISSKEKQKAALEKERGELHILRENLIRREQAIFPREEAALAKEKRAEQLETEWEESRAAQVHHSHQQEIQRLEKCLQKEITTNEALMKQMEVSIVSRNLTFDDSKESSLGDDVKSSRQKEDARSRDRETPSSQHFSLQMDVNPSKAAEAEQKLRNAVSTMKRIHENKPTGTIGRSISPKRSAWPPWKKWWRLAGGNSLSLGEFRCMIRRSVGIGIGMVGDRDVRLLYYKVCADHNNGLAVNEWEAWWTKNEVLTVDIAL